MTVSSDQHQEALDLLKRTHQIFCGIKGKDITLIPANPPGCTDCESFISLPIEDPEADIIHKHEWSHIFFKSNLRARQSFVDAYVAQLKTRIRGSEQWQNDICNFVHLFINALDDLRVCSLWERIYPHSADRIRERWRTIIASSKRYKKDIVMLLMALGVGLGDDVLEHGEWDCYKPLLARAAGDVMGRGFPSCLVTARTVLDAIINEVVSLSLTGQAPTPMPAQGQAGCGRPARDPSELVSKMARGPSSRTRWDLQQGQGSLLQELGRMPSGPDAEFKSTQAMVRAAMGVTTPDQVAYVLEQSLVDINKVLEALRGTNTKRTPDEKLLQGLEGHVSFVDVRPTMVQEMPLSIQDRRLVQVLKQSFTKLMDRRSRVRSESGSEFDANAYIDMIYGDGDDNIFREETSSRGFSSLVLIDMSGSMRPKWGSVSRACKVLAKAMKFPFSSFEVWGFSSSHEGKTSILRFEDTERGYMGPGLRNIWGLTPLHQAVEVGVRRLQFMPGTVQHLFVLTDGYPTHFGLRHGTMPATEELVAAVAKNIRGGRQKGVNVAGLVLGWEVGDEAADIMFGHSRFWSRVGEEEDLFQGMVGLVRTAFSNYLRKR